MPTSTRRQAAREGRANEPSSDEPGTPSREAPGAAMPNVVGDEELEDEDEELDEEEEEEEEDGPEEDEGEEEEEEEEAFEQEPFPPPGLKEISSLASWTVSTAKPGNGVAALRSPETSLFWQSDGPQPHLLSIHFFKVVSIVHMRIYLDFERDESYTPTKMQFLAGMGVHDLQEFAEMSFEQPTGWIDVDFSNVGPIEEDDDDDDRKEVDWSKRPVLRAFLVQIKILENHQNGKDTHLRAVQIFATDEEQKTVHAGKKVEKSSAVLPVRGAARRLKARIAEPNNISMASWMMDPDLR